MWISEQKWSKAPCKAPLLLVPGRAQLCSLALQHHLKGQAENHFNHLFLLHTQHLGRDCLSQGSSTLNLRTLHQNCVSPAHSFIFRAGSTYSSSPPAKLHSEQELLWGMCISAQIIFSCSSSQPLHALNWAGFWTSDRVSLFQEAIQAQVLNHPVCYWCCSWRNWFPASVRASHSLCQKSDI